MRPVRELADVAAGLRGLFCDLDDTLTEKGRLDTEAYSALVAAARAGLRVVVVTGRPGGWAEVLASMWPVAAVVAENGAVAVRVERDASGHARLRRWFWDPEPARQQAEQRLAAILADVRAAVPRARLAADQHLRSTDLAFDVGETLTLSESEVGEILERIGRGGARHLVSTVHAHAFFGDHDKAKMLVRLGGELWGESPEAIRDHYLFIGDSPNDQAGFAYFRWSAGVANVTRFEHALAPPPGFVASAGHGRGFAEIVSIVLSRQQKAHSP